jgi:hypothetical protein
VTLHFGAALLAGPSALAQSAIERAWSDLRARKAALFGSMAPAGAPSMRV